MMKERKEDVAGRAGAMHYYNYHEVRQRQNQSQHGEGEKEEHEQEHEQGDEDKEGHGVKCSVQNHFYYCPTRPTCPAPDHVRAACGLKLVNYCDESPGLDNVALSIIHKRRHSLACGKVTFRKENSIFRDIIDEDTSLYDEMTSRDAQTLKVERFIMEEEDCQKKL